VYKATHQLLNLYFVKPTEPDYEAKREKFTKKRTFHEFAINIGGLVHYTLLKDVRMYFLGSIGPMMSTTETERLAKGFAFSDVAALGIFYTIKKITIDIRGVLRHTSNAGLQSPNLGHNSTGFETAVSVSL
jgi:hypothetical protein